MAKKPTKKSREVEKRRKTFSRKSKPKSPAAKPAEKKAPSKEMESPLALIPPVPDEEGTKQKDEFFDEEEMKEFSVKDEEEDAEDDSESSGEGEPAWTEEEY